MDLESAKKTNEMIKNSPKKQQHIVDAQDVLTIKSSRVPVNFVKDNKLQGYSPHKETIQDFLPINPVSEPKTIQTVRRDETYPKQTQWQLEQSQKRNEAWLSQKLVQDMTDEYRKNRNASYSHQLIQQIQNKTKSRVESDLTLRAHDSYMVNLAAQRAEAKYQDEMATRNRWMQETKTDLSKQMKDHRRAKNISNKKKQKLAIELKLLDKLDTERDRVQTTTQRLRDLEIQRKNQQISSANKEQRDIEQMKNQQVEASVKPWVDENDYQAYKTQKKDFFLMGKRKENKSGAHAKFTEKFAPRNYLNLNRTNNLIQKNIRDYQEEQRKMDMLQNFFLYEHKKEIQGMAKYRKDQMESKKGTSMAEKLNR